MLVINPNGPAIKLVGVAERMEVVTTNPIRGTSWYTTVMNEAWRIFCRPGTYYVNYTRVAVQGLLGASNKSRCTEFDRKQVRGPELSRFTKLSK